MKTIEEIIQVYKEEIEPTGNCTYNDRAVKRLMKEYACEVIDYLISNDIDYIYCDTCNHIGSARFDPEQIKELKQQIINEQV